MDIPMNQTKLDDGLRELLAAWTHRDDLRRDQAPIAELAVANQRLFETRLATRSTVRSIAHAA